MSIERTQHQSTREIDESRKLSLEPTRPPATIPGYKIVKYLGSGAYGEVWSAHDLKTGRNVAIKFFTRGSAADISLLASEVEKLALLGADRSVVQLLNVGWDASPPYYVMDYLEHGSLEDKLKNQNSLPTAQSLELFQELATGMLHMHNKGILHCDLKPANVMLDQEGKPRIADFGQSRLSTGDTPSLGTLFYMAPEQADLNALPDAKWDVYALGAIFFSMLTGKPPYYCQELAKQIEKSDDIDGRLNRYRDALLMAPKPTEHRTVPGVDRPLGDIIDNCIAANPNQRFANIASILVALRQREIAKARRPLMLLGLVGPAILIMLMSIFGWLAFRESVRQTKVEITRKAEGANEFAAKLAARSAAEQIHDYFRTVTQLARDPALLASLETFLDDEELQRWSVRIADPAFNAYECDHPNSDNAEIARIRESLRASPIRANLQPFLEQRLINRSGEFPVASSWFICDRFGNQIASAFRSASPTLGRNYAYRSYFTGLEDDMPPARVVSVDPGLSYEEKVSQLQQRTMIAGPHLSAAFRSEQSNSWKLAFSCPILRDGEPVALVAVTVDLGNFIDFENQQNHYAMLVDARSGQNRGIILEHPLFQSTLATMGRLPEELSRSLVDLDELIQIDTQHSRFRDPVGKSPLGKDYHQESIVGTAEVMMLKTYELTLENNIDEKEEAIQTTSAGSASASPDRNAPLIDEVAASHRGTGLIVLTVEDYAEVVKPANNLIYQWGKLALLASFFLLNVSFVMWYFVKRLLQESREKLDRAFSPSRTESGSARERETLPAINYDGTTEAR